eukprot:CAMPEP_0206178446 /NCGR_PEP_ID=MMETSP1474-20131121/64280_1 /ASSEMBLY_ACC=CAM_ASM_001110 /TAXON_ID=97495 /ORGANISM="Imantonia sp., Strain RCC918" /LENGTH=119 /DNA_ID=CAMNT_0053590953 /DNA_START=323 /DNA_END=678 /DNA_ORIENTATION=+
MLALGVQITEMCVPQLLPLVLRQLLAHVLPRVGDRLLEAAEQLCASDALGCAVLGCANEPLAPIQPWSDPRASTRKIDDLSRGLAVAQEPEVGFGLDSPRTRALASRLRRLARGGGLLA